MEPTLLMALKEDIKEDKHTWYLDNGASNHMCGEKDKFVELDEKVHNGNIIFGDTSKIPIKGKGSILFHLQNRKQKMISNVYYMSKLKNNFWIILSLG